MRKCWETFIYWAFSKDELYTLVDVNPETGKIIVPKDGYEVSE
jgi:hypothetical protein